jgi:uncharacterized alkaline shock family protein YloU
VPTDHSSGRSLVSRRAVFDIVRAATLGSYGVTGFAANPVERAAGAIGLAEPGIRLGVRDRLELDLDLTVAYGLPVAEVARQVDSAVRYAMRRSLGREVDRLSIHVLGLRVQPASAPPRATHAAAGITSADLAASGTDVA